MEKISNLLKSTLGFFLILTLALSPLTSCENDFKKDTIDPTTAPPVITSISEAREDVPVTQGVLDGTYIIRGKNLSSLVSIHFNGREAGFNPALLTDNIAFVQIPEDAPFVNQKNKLTLTSLSGTVDYDFSLLSITDFEEKNVAGTKIVTLVGGDFTDTATVTFVSGSVEQGNLVEKPAKIVAITGTEVDVEVPAGVEQAFIFLATTRGAVAQSSSYGFSLPIFVDALNPDWKLNAWPGNPEPAVSKEVALGETAIKSTMAAWSGFTIWAPNIPFKEYKAITVSVYSTKTEGNSIRLALNDFNKPDEFFLELKLVPGEWNKLVIPLSDFYPNGGEPNSIFRMDVQEASNTGLSEYIFYVDDFGFL